MNTATLRIWWSQRPAREQTLLQLGGLLLAAALLWSVALAPALRTLRTFETQHASQATQLQNMLRLQAQAQALQAVPSLSQAAATQALQLSVQQTLGASADMTIRGDNATVTLRNVSAESLAQWLASARTHARCTPLQAHLTRSAAGWSGTLQLALPPP